MASLFVRRESHISKEEVKEHNQGFKIVVTSGTHLGLREDQPQLEFDPIDVIEEVLQIAEKEQADFVLHGGNLFDLHAPSLKTQACASRIMKQYIFGEKTHKFTVKVPSTQPRLEDGNQNSKQRKNIASSQDSHDYLKKFNFLDGNLKVKLPIFIINGTHDDWTGRSRLSPLDCFHAHGFVNYIGKIVSQENLKVKPLIFKKHETSINLYPLSHIQDNKLNALLKTNSITFDVPATYEEDFNILFIHQNRNQKSQGGDQDSMRKRKVHTNAGVDQTLIPPFFDLIIWCNEHHSSSKVEQCGPFQIISPGTTIVTNFNPEHRKDKGCWILDIKRKRLEARNFALNRARALVFAEVDLRQTEAQSEDIDLLQDIIVAQMEESYQGWQQRRKMKRAPFMRINAIVNKASTKAALNKFRLMGQARDFCVNPESAFFFIIRPTQREKKDRTGFE